MPTSAIALIALSLSLAHVDFWRASAFWGTAVILAIVVWKMRRFAHVSLWSLGAYLAGSYLYHCLYPSSRYENFGTDVVYRMLALQGQGALFFFGSVLLLKHYSKNLGSWDEPSAKFWYFFTIAQSGLMIFNYFFKGYAGGFINIESVDACFLSLFMPLALAKSMWRTFYFALTAVVLSGSATAFVMLPIMLTSMELGPRPKARHLWVVGALVVGALSMTWIAPKLFSDSGRYHFIRIAMRYWWDKVNIWVGSGPSTFELFGPHVQYLNGHAMTTWDAETKFTSWWIWMHSDWLQLLFETGLIGALLALWVFASTLGRLWSVPWLRASVIGFGLMMITQMPFRHFLPTLFAVYLLGFTVVDSDE